MLVLVLIESDWNLKIILLIKYLSPFKVLIESDWNLKYKDTASAFPTGKSINRIRLEFKEKTFKIINKLIYSINRIRLEFKEVSGESKKSKKIVVLIESDWNLKAFISTYH